MQTRIYEVLTDDEDSRLVEAASASAAIRHVAAPKFKAEVANAKRVALLMAGGKSVEKAKGLAVAGEAK
jgi:hypothetical protein